MAAAAEPAYELAHRAHVHQDSGVVFYAVTPFPTQKHTDNELPGQQIVQQRAVVVTSASAFTSLDAEALRRAIKASGATSDDPFTLA